MIFWVTNGEHTLSTSSHPSTAVGAKKYQVTVWAASWTTSFFFMEHHFHLREQLSDKNYSDSVVCIWQTFSIINEVRLSLPEKPLKSFCWLIKTGAFKWKSQLGKPASATVSLTASCFKDPSVKISADRNKWENEMRQYSEEPQSSMGQHFLHTRRMSRNPAGEKGLLRARQTTEC